MKYLNFLILIIRPLNTLIAFFSIFVVYSLFPGFDISLFTLIALVLFCYMSGGYILNDFLDMEIDKINKPHRALVKYKINDYVIVIFIVSFFIIGTLIASLLSPLSRDIAIYIALPGIIIYEFIFKRIALIGNIIISILVGLVFVYSEAAITGDVTITYKIMILAFSLNLIREVIKDIQDEKGDRAHYFKTLPIILGITGTIYIVRFLSIMFFVVSLLFAPQFMSPFFLPLIFFIIHLPLLYINLRLTDNISSKECARFSNILKLMIIAGVLIVLILA